MRHAGVTKSVLLVLLISLVSTRPVQALTTSPEVLITELQTANTTASEEFIELYNTTDHDIDLADTANQGQDIWKIQFFSSTKVTASGINWDPGTSGLTTLTLTRPDNTAVIIRAHSYFVISTKGTETYKPGNVEPDLTYSSGHMSDSGGGVQLVEAKNSAAGLTTIVHDHIGWFQPTGTMVLPAGLYLTPPAGSSLQRTINQDGTYLNENDLELIITSSDISPGHAWVQLPDTVSDTTLQVDNSGSTPVTEDLTVTATDAEATTDPSAAVIAVPLPADQLQPVQITELLPNPASPQTDAQDEYIELFNPNNQLFDLNNYTLQTGLKYSYSFKLVNQTIQPNAYLVLTSGETHLALANSGGQARLLDPNAQTVSETTAYSTAPSGQAWALTDDGWQWTTTPTPAATNELTLPVIATKAATKAPTPKASSTKPKAATTKKTAVKAAKTTKAAPPKATTAAQEAVDEANRPTPLHRAVLVGVAAIAVLYGAYEYRTDMGNKLYQFRRNREARRLARQAAQGTGSD